MSLTTVTVSIASLQATGAALPNGIVTLTLTAMDINGAFIAPEPTIVTLDASGLGTVSLWPNSLGSQGTQYRVVFCDKDAVMQWSGLATIPNSACNLHDCITTAPPALSDAQVALNGAQAAQAAAAVSAGTATTQAGIATTQAGIATGVLSDAGFIAVKNDLSNIDTVGSNIANVNTVAGISTNVTAVAADTANINTVAADLANINIVAGDHASVAALGPISANITAVAGDLANVNAVAADVTNLNAVAGDLTAINAVAADLPAINGAAGNAAATAADVVTANALLVSTQSLFNRIYLGAF